SDDAHLSATAGAVLGWIGARFDPEFLDVFEARLQLEGRRHFAIEVAWSGIDDRRSFDAVVADRILFDRAAREPDVLPCSSPGVLGTGSPQQQLRHLAAVHRQIVNLALAQI